MYQSLALTIGRSDYAGWLRSLALCLIRLQLNLGVMRLTTASAVVGSLDHAP